MVPFPFRALKLCLQSSGSGAGLSPLVNFYSKLPKGPAPVSAVIGIKGRFFNGKNASGVPLVAAVAGIFVLGYTIDYQSEFSSFLRDTYQLMRNLLPQCI